MLNRGIKTGLLSLGIAALIYVSGCGYHLRGAQDFPQALQHTYVMGASLTLQEQFRKALRNADGQLTAAPEEARVIINILDEQVSQQVLSLSARGRSNELELFYRVEYEVLAADKQVLMPRQRLEVKREYYNNQQDIIAKANEEAVIREEMRHSAVRLIIDRARIVLAAHPNDYAH